VQRWRGVADAPDGWGRCVVTIGVFDGVHRGHQQIVGRTVQRARDAGVPAVVLAFDPNPIEVLRPGTEVVRLTAPDFQAELLAGLGVDVLCVLAFTAEFSRQSPEEFVDQTLVGALHAAHVVVGANFRYGHKAAGTVESLRESGSKHGFTVEAVPMIADGALAYSSTSVRASIESGDVVTAARALGHGHRLDGVVVRGDGRGRKLGYPTANLRLTLRAAVPADGVYAGRVVLGERRLPAAISVGTNPTFDGHGRRVEAHILDFDEDIYDDPIGIEFTALVRPMERFDSVDELIAQMARDVARTREIVR